MRDRSGRPLVRRLQPRSIEAVERLTRRRTLQGVGALMGITALGGCDDDAGSGDSAGGTGGGTGDASGDSGDSGGVGSACNDPGDLSVTELLAGIETIVVVMMENRSFDHYFGSYSLAEGAAVDGLTGNERNLDRDGGAVEPFKSDLYVIDEDPPHGWDASHAQWNAGKNDGFVSEYQLEGSPDGRAVMGYHVREQLPTLYGLADEYVLCDQWFGSVMGPTWPNRWHLHLGTSGEHTDNPEGTGLTGFPSIFDRMTDAGLPSVYYNSGLPFPLTYGRVEGIEPIENFFTAAAAGNLPALVMVEPLLTALDTIGNDDHPPADIRMGQAFLSSIYQALAQSPQWGRCLLIITYDEHGGFYDHVSPPTTVDDRPGFEQLGFRVPSVVIGPHVRRGCVSSVQLDHVSVLSTLTRRFELEPLNARTEATSDISAAIDPMLLGAPRQPAALPPVELSLPPDWSMRRLGANYGGQTELWRLGDRGGFPRHLDRRREVDDVARAILEHGQRLGAVKLV